MKESYLNMCFELYELSGWETDPVSYHWVGLEKYVLYDCGYLLRKLPKATHLTKRSDYRRSGDKDYLARINFGSYTNKPRKWLNQFYIDGDTPEEALMGLAIQLFKNGLENKVN